MPFKSKKLGEAIANSEWKFPTEPAVSADAKGDLI